MADSPARANISAVGNVIEYLCANQQHWPEDDARDPIVIHAGKAAYCPLGADGDHDWRATGGKTLTTVRQWMGRRAPESAAS